MIGLRGSLRFTASRSDPSGTCWDVSETLLLGGNSSDRSRWASTLRATAPTPEAAYLNGRGLQGTFLLLRLRSSALPPRSFFAAVLVVSLLLLRPTSARGRG